MLNDKQKVSIPRARNSTWFINKFNKNMINIILKFIEALP